MMQGKWRPLRVEMLRPEERTELRAMVGDYIHTLEAEQADVLPFVAALLRGIREARPLTEPAYLERIAAKWEQVRASRGRKRAILRAELVGMLLIGLREFVPHPPAPVQELVDRLDVPVRPWRIWRRGAGNPRFELAVAAEPVYERARALVSGPGREQFRAYRGEHYPRALLERLSREFGVSTSTIRRRLVEAGFRLPDDLRFRRRRR